MRPKKLIRVSEIISDPSRCEYRMTYINPQKQISKTAHGFKAVVEKRLYSTKGQIPYTKGESGVRTSTSEIFVETIKQRYNVWKAKPPSDDKRVCISALVVRILRNKPSVFIKALFTDLKDSYLRRVCSQDFAVRFLTKVCIFLCQLPKGLLLLKRVYKFHAIFTSASDNLPSVLELSAYFFASQYSHLSDSFLPSHDIQTGNHSPSNSPDLTGVTTHHIRHIQLLTSHKYFGVSVAFCEYPPDPSIIRIVLRTDHLAVRNEYLLFTQTCTI